MEWEKYWASEWVRCSAPNLDYLERTPDRDKDGYEYYRGVSLWFRCRSLVRGG